MCKTFYCSTCSPILISLCHIQPTTGKYSLEKLGTQPHNASRLIWFIHPVRPPVNLICQPFNRFIFSYEVCTHLMTEKYGYKFNTVERAKWQEWSQVADSNSWSLYLHGSDYLNLYNRMSDFRWLLRTLPALKFWKTVILLYKGGEKFIFDKLWNLLRFWKPLTT